ncbi:MAG: hypothetical protein VKI82_04595 [Leptolyngbya sp.]|nr:hypothetical protein [Leptolyngbya sp.]
MANQRPPSRIHPKVSTLPRQRTEAAHYLDLYKLTVEKKRIQQELETLEKRRERLYARLAEIDQETDRLNGLAGTIRLQDSQRLGTTGSRPAESATPSSNVFVPERPNQTPGDFNTVLLEY